MKPLTSARIILAVAVAAGLEAAVHAATAERPTQFLMVNRTPNQGWNRGQPEPVGREAFEEIKRAFPEVPQSGLRVGIGFIFSYFRTPDDASLLASLRQVLALARKRPTRRC